MLKELVFINTISGKHSLNEYFYTFKDGTEVRVYAPKRPLRCDCVLLPVSKKLYDQLREKGKNLAVFESTAELCDYILKNSMISGVEA